MYKGYKDSYPFIPKKYTLKKFNVKPLYSNCQFELLSVNFLENEIGYFNITNPITINNNGKNKFFFIKNHKSNDNEVMGTIAFKFNTNTEKWKIDYVALKVVPNVLLSSKKVLTEKWM